MHCTAGLEHSLRRRVTPINGMEWWYGQIVKLHLMENFYLISQGMPAMACSYACVTSDGNNYPMWYLYYEATNKELRFVF